MIFRSPVGKHPGKCGTEARVEADCVSRRRCASLGGQPFRGAHDARHSRASTRRSARWKAASRPSSPSRRPRSAPRRPSAPPPMTAWCSRWSTTRTTSGSCATACSTCSTGAQILKSGSLAPAVTPFVRIPPNGGENSQWIAKQVLDIGVYGIVWPHVSRSRTRATRCRPAAIRARARRPTTIPPASAATRPRTAARYWGIDQQTTTRAPTPGR